MKVHVIPAQAGIQFSRWDVPRSAGLPVIESRIPRDPFYQDWTPACAGVTVLDFQDAEMTNNHGDFSMKVLGMSRPDRVYVWGGLEGR